MASGLRCGSIFWAGLCGVGSAVAEGPEYGRPRYRCGGKLWPKFAEIIPLCCCCGRLDDAPLIGPATSSFEAVSALRNRSESVAVALSGPFCGGSLCRAAARDANIRSVDASWRSWSCSWPCVMGKIGVFSRTFGGLLSS